MKLYFATGTCSMSCVMEIKELGIACELVEVSWKRNENVEELMSLNPLGTTPVLVSDEGKVLTQNIAVLEYLADKYSKGQHLPAVGTWERVQTMSWLSFVASDFHKAFGPAFRSEEMAHLEVSQKQIEQFAKNNISDYVAHVNCSLRDRNYITGSQFTVADCYLFTILRWCEWVDIGFSEYHAIESYMKRMNERPAIKKTLELEGD